VKVFHLGAPLRQQPVGAVDQLLLPAKLVPEAALPTKEF
jgi:hypothetical protein